MSSFDVMCKAICHWIQNRLLYSPVKFQGRTTAWTRVISKFQMTTQNGNCFLYSLYVTFLCSRGVLKRLFVRLMKPIYETMCLCRTSWLGFFCTLLIIIKVRRMFVQTGLVQQSSFMFRFRAICCKFLESVEVLCFGDISYKLCYIWEKYSKEL